MSSPSPLNRPSGLPLRANSPAPLEHPQLCEVKTLRESLTQGIIGSTKTDVESTSDNNRKKFLQLNSLIESSDNHPAPERAACVPDTRFVRVSAVLAEIGGGNG